MTTHAPGISHERVMAALADLNRMIERQQHQSHMTAQNAAQR